MLSLATVASADDTPHAATVQENQPTNDDVMRAYAQLQEQIRATQLAVASSRAEEEAAAEHNAEAMSNRFEAIEKTLASQRDHELEVMRSNNETMLLAAWTFAGLGFIGMLFTAWLQWRSANRFSEMAASSNMTRALLPERATPGGDVLAITESIAAANSRLLGSISVLEQRILALEHTGSPTAEHAVAEHKNGTGTNGSDTSHANGAAEQPVNEHAAQVTVLLGKGQSLLTMGQPEEAIACFDEVLALDQNNTDALVKKGVALERQRRLDEAVGCYDRAIAADSSVTIAYLYKGGIFNRQERFPEALECYEQALKSQEKRRG